MDSPDRLREVALSGGVEPSQHCCLQMAARVALGAAARPDLPVLIWVRAWDEYWIPVAGGPSVDSKGSEWSREAASSCPWCGHTLPVSKRERWYERLYALGFEDPGNEAIPPEFNSDAWWREADD